jgi:putative heme-binding domain-containing protein
MRYTCLLVMIATLAASPTCGFGQGTIAEQLAAEGPEALAVAARREGNAERGAIVFHLPQSTCTRCHAVNDHSPSLGPSLITSKDALDDARIVEAILSPSKAIRKGYEATTLATKDGRTLTGVIAESTEEACKLWDPAGGGAQIVVPRDEIEEQAVSNVSLMPEGVANLLTSRQQFLDLVRYLFEIRDGGLARAQALQPPPSAYALRIPEYEQHVDHAGLIRALDDAALDRGRAIYERVCQNCHGTAERAGSLPTSLKFASGAFRNGFDPAAMYRTLTHGFGQMTPQTWMVPRQKYDVIHFIRETYLRSLNTSQYAAVDDAYLTGLPTGDTFGPEPQLIEPWSAMDYGPTLTHTYERGDDGTNFAYKGVAVRLDPGAGGVARGKAWMIFDHDTMRIAAAWLGEGFIDWNGVQFTGQHEIHPRVVGEVAFANATGPGWANPLTGRFDDDERVVGRDGRRYGPLPRDWAQYHGHYQHGQRVIFSYRVGDAEILEMPGVAHSAKESTSPDSPFFTRAFRIHPHSQELRLLVATLPDATAQIEVDGDRVRVGSLISGLSQSIPGAAWLLNGRRLVLNIPASDKFERFVLWAASRPVDAAPLLDDAAPDLDALTNGGPDLWSERLTTTAQIGANDGPFTVDTLVHPEANPWLAQMRFTGLDFYADGDRLAACTWDGDVWEVSGLSSLKATLESSANPSTNLLTWRRVASGLFQPLGIKVIEGVIHATCRDQLVVLRDRNRDGFTDFYECLNNDHQVTEHFHEFAMGLQTDADGNFYYAKSARHALKAIVPQHGTLLRVSRDGARTDILANGFRAANGVCLNPDGSFFVTDQEGHWNPKNRINWVTLDPSGKPKFYGNMFGYHDVTDSSDERMEKPLCWITNAFDRSPAELLWVDSEKWGPLNGRLLNLSYGYGKAFVVPHEHVDGVMQGGMCELPFPSLPTGIMRGRFHPQDGQLYTCGMFAWAGSAIQPGGLYRIRATDRPMHLPVELHATQKGMQITFTEPLDAEAARDLLNYQVTTWSLKRTENYGSDHYNTKQLAVASVELSADRKSVTLVMPGIRPTWCMEINYSLKLADGTPFLGVIHNTVHRLAP